MSDIQKVALVIVELGGYPNFVPQYEALGYQVALMPSMRKALTYLKKHEPDLVVAEFNFQSDFRDRSSNLESLFARLQRYPQTKVMIFLETRHREQFTKVSNRFAIDATLTYPIQEKQLLAALASI